MEAPARSAFPHMSEYRSKLYDRYVSSGMAPGGRGSADSLSVRAPYLKALVRKHFPTERDGKIIDLGCGHGALVHFARLAGYQQATGVDISPEQVELAQSLGVDGIRQGNVFEALRDLPDCSQSVVIAFDVLEHLTRDEALAFSAQVQRVLVAGGRFIVHVPNAESPFFGRVRYGDLTHEQAFTSSSIHQLLSASGFAHVECFEDVPIVHSIFSAVRWALWKMFRLVLATFAAVETGVLRGGIFSQNLLAVAHNAVKSDGSESANTIARTGTGWSSANAIEVRRNSAAQQNVE